MQPEYDHAQTNAYWKAVHAHGRRLDAERDPDLLEVVCHPGRPIIYNRYVAWAQARAFHAALRHCPTLRGRDVIEVGCGTGRWSHRLRAMGARVLATDLSPDAIERNRRRITGVQFEAGDFLTLDLPARGYDAAVSVTVLQHLPPAQQEEAAVKLGRIVRPGGHVVLLENTHDRGFHVFARSLADWESLFASAGFSMTFAVGYEYDIPIRVTNRILTSATGSRGAASVEAAGSPEDAARMMFGGRVAKRALRALVYGPAVLAAYPIELLSHALLPGRMATHAAMVFRLAGGGSVQ